MNFPAVDGVGKTVLIIKDNKVVGKGVSQTSFDGMVGITISDDAGKDFFKDDYAVKTLGWRFTFFHYYESTGNAAFSYTDEPEDRLKGTRIIDEFNLRWGMVPESFKSVNGYRSCESKMMG